ncbi:dihydroanticapsin 7-dehydrogenase [Actinomadura kijaniata]|uniref:NAD(P)-dependent dehydrogenase (Short-subunit alcohol dehydrogenase family) n=1 Tax=Actinomadura namibiensis TaxID=182080 RepID=A0A7W3LZZ6_ACTNM|nr:SDR family NAD(P)-dependent oxidoreductase [Actinomadura namibiensis]MBA8957339.1 NAD(P)-dependent dehydrogenase (short-subunit alcohol dehydrogenase family) [Actinomadura namibiensis]
MDEATGEDPFGLRDASALVVGGASGLGRAVTERLVKAGCRVTVADVADEPGERLAKELAERGGEVVYRHADARRRNEVDAAVAAARAEFGPLEVAVNVVGNPGGIAGVKPFLDMTEDDLRARWELNFLSTFLCCRSEALAMIRDGVAGRIVNFGSSSGMVGAPNISGYGAAKAGVIHFTKSAAMELARYGIRVNCVVPGTHVSPSQSPVTDERIAEFRRRAAEAPVLRRLGEPRETAGVALFLASELSGYMTGHSVVSDGGVVHTTARPPVGMDREAQAVRALRERAED